MSAKAPAFLVSSVSRFERKQELVKNAFEVKLNEVERSE
jgi:hypothetical protein